MSHCPHHSFCPFAKVQLPQQLRLALSPPLTTPSPSLLDAVARLVAAKGRANRRPKSITNIRQYLTAFIRGREGDPITSISHVEVEAWLHSRHSTPSGRSTGLNRISGLFSFALRQGWVVANPCDRVERVTVEHTAPTILNAESAGRLLSVCPADLRPWVVTGLFCGLRPSEAERLDWSAVRIADRVLVVDAAASKVRRRRIVPLNDTATVWLRLDARSEGPVSPPLSTLRRRRRDTAKASGISWTQDVLRHTYASMRMAAGANAHELADEMGNSPRILLTHYRELVRREEAERFWGIRPRELLDRMDREPAP